MPWNKWLEMICLQWVYDDILECISKIVYFLNLFLSELMWVVECMHWIWKLPKFSTKLYSVLKFSWRVQISNLFSLYLIPNWIQEENRRAKQPHQFLQQKTKVVDDIQNHKRVKAMCFGRYAIKNSSMGPVTSVFN